jgi:hypothetical protein
VSSFEVDAAALGVDPNCTAAGFGARPLRRNGTPIGSRIERQT